MTFWGVLLVLDRFQPSAFVLENVPGILVNQQLEKAIAKLQNKGYIVTWKMQSPRDAGIPHDRDRVWIAGFRASTVSHSRNFVHDIDALWASLVANRHSSSDIDSFLYYEVHAHICRRHELHMAAFEKNVDKAGLTCFAHALTQSAKQIAIEIE